MVENKGSISHLISELTVDSGEKRMISCFVFMYSKITKSGQFDGEVKRRLLSGR